MKDNDYTPNLLKKQFENIKACGPDAPDGWVKEIIKTPFGSEIAGYISGNLSVGISASEESSDRIIHLSIFDLDGRVLSDDTINHTRDLFMGGVKENFRFMSGLGTTHLIFKSLGVN